MIMCLQAKLIKCSTIDIFLSKKHLGAIRGKDLCEGMFELEPWLLKSHACLVSYWFKFSKDALLS